MTPEEDATYWHDKYFDLLKNVSDLLATLYQTLFDLSEKK